MESILSPLKASASIVVTFAGISTDIASEPVHPNVVSRFTGMVVSPKPWPCRALVTSKAIQVVPPPHQVVVTFAGISSDIGSEPVHRNALSMSAGMVVTPRPWPFRALVT